MTDDALARVKAARALYIPKPQLADGFYLNADIDALVREVEAARAFGDAYDEWLGIFRDMIARESIDRALDLVRAKGRLGVARELLDAARKGAP